MKVSVIIPIYNTGEYLRACIDSICRQTFADLQIIMIDDGSDAVTSRICDEIAAVDNRIELIHKCNEGVSRARNVGLDQAVGEVVCFVDSDDTIHPRMIETLVEALHRDDSDIAMCDAETITPGLPNEPDTIPDFEESCVIETSSLPTATLTRLAGSACRCAYKRTDTLLSTGAHFPEGIKFSEDRIFNIIAMSGAKKISYLKVPFYNRLIRQGSACFRYYPDMTEQLEKMREVLLSSVRKHWGEKYVEEYEYQIAGQVLFAVTNYTALNNVEDINAKLRNLRKLCKSKSLNECLCNSGINDIRATLINHNMFRSLLLIGTFTDIYHRICQKR